MGFKDSVTLLEQDSGLWANQSWPSLQKSPGLAPSPSPTTILCPDHPNSLPAGLPASLYPKQQTL